MLDFRKLNSMISDIESYNERIAICIHMGRLTESQATRIALSEQPKEESPSVRKAKELRARIASDKLAKRNIEERY